MSTRRSAPLPHPHEIIALDIQHNFPEVLAAGLILESFHHVFHGEVFIDDWSQAIGFNGSNEVFLMAAAPQGGRRRGRSAAPPTDGERIR